MTTTNPIPPVAVYTDVDDTDITPGITLLEEAGFEVRVLGTREPEAIVSGGQGAEVLLPGYSEITRDMIERLPSLKLISLMSMGTDNVDVEAATDHGIFVTNVPGAATEEVATHALSILLAGLRQLPFYTHSANPLDWNDRAPVAPRRLSELTLGVLGLGRIGKKLAHMASPLFAEVIGYDPYLPNTAEVQSDIERLGIRRCELADVQTQADVLCLHLPLSQTTQTMINADFMARMPEKSFLVNVSRGGLIDHSALASALESGHLAGAALDVLDEEPPSGEHPLVGRSEVIITPHIAYYSDRTLIDYVRIQAQNAISFVRTCQPDSPVNAPKPQGFPPHD
ncbi:C-terminal binding protein [Rothia uropygioeca]|uniref:C-terminal binding protein n=1 Tax=Kocuria sp. 257 TaxID=2021970 RepID=UPI001012B020|nr:C-terminal binding protein [Kocuria sp. 257]